MDDDVESVDDVSEIKTKNFKTTCLYSNFLHVLMRGIRGFIPETTPIPTLLDSAHDTVLMGPCKLRKDFLKNQTIF